MARFRVDVPLNGQVVQAQVPWPVYGMTIDNGSDQVCVVTDDAGRTYQAGPGQVWGGDVPATVTFQAKLNQAAVRGAATLWLYDTLGLAVRGGAGGGATSGGGMVPAYWDRYISRVQIGNNASWPATATLGPSLLVAAGQTAMLPGGWIELRRVAAAVTRRDFRVDFYLSLPPPGVGGVFRSLVAPSGWTVIGQAIRVDWDEQLTVPAGGFVAFNGLASPAGADATVMVDCGCCALTFGA